MPDKKTNMDEMIKRHLLSLGTITGCEAGSLYKTRCLTSNIARLRASGLTIISERKTDATGQRYVRYHCTDSKQCTYKV